MVTPAAATPMLRYRMIFLMLLVLAAIALLALVILARYGR
jgi:hypothetical protein